MGEGLEILPKTVREILKIDNDEIIRLCQSGNLPLKQNDKGLTYFTTEDVKTLKRLQDVQNKAKYHEEKSVQLKNALKKIPAKKSEISAEKEHIEKEAQLPVPTKPNETVELLKQITGTVKNIENSFYDKFSLVLEEKLENKLENKLEEKLGGLDAVIMDLVRCKTEADEMRKQLAENSKEIYALKDELSCYKKVAGNLYIKKAAKNAFDL